MKQLLTIAPPTPAFPRDALDAPGGFLWWYTDVWDAQGNGLVLIWSYGLPFLPGYNSAARRGAGELPRSRPSLNIAVAREGKLAFYLLQELPEDEADWNELDWRFGSSRMHARTTEDGQWELDVELDCPVPGVSDRLRGSVQLRGVARRASDDDAYGHHHDWAPFTGPATTDVSLGVGDERYEFAGRGYFDGNSGADSFESTGIHRWTWGRLSAPDRELIYYVLWRAGGDLPEAHGIEIDERGILTRSHLDVAVTNHRRGRAGVEYPAELDLRREGRMWASVRTRTLTDDGPFYLRYFIEGTTPNGSTWGIGEYCRTDRIDLARHRPLVRMRVHRPHADNSIWLPLFTGPRRGRMRRLLGQLKP